MNPQTKTAASALLHVAIAAGLLGLDAAVTAITQAVTNHSIAVPATAVALVLALLGVAHTEIQSVQKQEPLVTPAANPPVAGAVAGVRVTITHRLAFV